MDKLFLNEYGIKKLLDFYAENTYVFNERRTLQGMYEIVLNKISNVYKELVIHKLEDNRVEITLTDDTGRITQRDKYIIRNNEFYKLDHIIQVGKTYRHENSDKKVSVLKQDKDRCILFSESISDPFIVAWGVKVDGDEISWCGGSYRNTIDSALEHFNINSKSTMQDINNKLSESRLNCHLDYNEISNKSKGKDIVK